MKQKQKQKYIVFNCRLKYPNSTYTFRLPHKVIKEPLVWKRFTNAMMSGTRGVIYINIRLVIRIDCNTRF